jgi:hypothetical protein
MFPSSDPEMKAFIIWDDTQLSFVNFFIEVSENLYSLSSSSLRGKR